MSTTDDAAIFCGGSEEEAHNNDRKIKRMLLEGGNNTILSTSLSELDDSASGSSGVKRTSTVAFSTVTPSSSAASHQEEVVDKRLFPSPPGEERTTTTATAARPNKVGFDFDGRIERYQANNALAALQAWLTGSSSNVQLGGSKNDYDMRALSRRASYLLEIVSPELASTFPTYKAASEDTTWVAFSSAVKVVAKNELFMETKKYSTVVHLSSVSFLLHVYFSTVEIDEN